MAHERVFVSEQPRDDGNADPVEDTDRQAEPGGNEVIVAPGSDAIAVVAGLSASACVSALMSVRSSDPLSKDAASAVLVFVGVTLVIAGTGSGAGTVTVGTSGSGALRSQCGSRFLPNHLALSA